MDPLACFNEFCDAVREGDFDTADYVHVLDPERNRYLVTIAGLAGEERWRKIQ